MTPGRRALLALLQRMPAREVALRAHVDPSNVSRWASGEWLPSARARRALEAHCRIRAVLWGVNSQQV